MVLWLDLNKTLVRKVIELKIGIVLNCKLITIDPFGSHKCLCGLLFRNRKLKIEVNIEINIESGDYKKLNTNSGF